MVREQEIVSVIIPTYNRAGLVGHAIISVINQTYENWELIIVDDGSTDDTRQRVDSFLKKDPRISYIYKENGGQGSARNLGIKHAKGEWILPLDSDDVLMPNCIENLVFIGEDMYADIVYGRTWRVLWDGRKVLGIGGPTPSSSILRKSVFLKYGFYDESRDLIEDVDHSYLLHPFIQSGEINFISTRIPVSVYFLHDGQSTSLLRPENLLMKANAMIEKWQTSLNGDTFREENMARQWRNKGAYEILLGEKRVGLNSLRQSLRLRWSFGTLLLLGSGMLGTSFFRRVVVPMKHFGEYANAKKSFILFAMGSSFGKNNKVKESVAFIHKT